MKIKPSKGYAIVNPKGHILPFPICSTKTMCIEVFITVSEEGRLYYSFPHNSGWDKASKDGWQCIKVDIAPSPEFIRDRLK